MAIWPAPPDPPEDLGPMATLLKSLMKSVRAEFCPDCMSSCINRVPSTSSFWGGLLDFHLDGKRKYKDGDCPAICSNKLHLVMPGEIQKFVHTNEVGLPDGHRLKYRIRDNEKMAYDRISYYGCDSEDYHPSPKSSDPSPGNLNRDWDAAWKDWKEKNKPETPKLADGTSIELNGPWFDDPPFRQESRLESPAEKGCDTILSKFSKVMDLTPRKPKGNPGRRIPKTVNSTGLNPADTTDGDLGEGHLPYSSIMTLCKSHNCLHPPDIRTNVSIGIILSAVSCLGKTVGLAADNSGRSSLCHWKRLVQDINLANGRFDERLEQMGTGEREYRLGQMHFDCQYENDECEMLSQYELLFGGENGFVSCADPALVEVRDAYGLSANG
ncbi:MAG: hypothetical protein M1816_003067 [Peltula sp. TS41687]|nr:MAG: hypothetical protein M1816_003067 [Peltula sp. TS41687]